MTAELSPGSYKLPGFRYHPDPVVTGSVVVRDVACVCCERARHYTYTGPVFAQVELDDSLCPWCIADGTAARRFDAQFTDISWAEAGGVSAAVTDEILHRTPGFAGWQQERWLHHCGDAAVFLGPVGAAEIADLADAVEALRHEGRVSDWSTEEIDRYIAALDKGGSPTAYLFRCRVCSVHLAYSDFI